MKKSYIITFGFLGGILFGYVFDNVMPIPMFLFPILLIIGVVMMVKK